MTRKFIATFGAGALAGFAAAWFLLDAGTAGVLAPVADAGAGTSRPTPPAPARNRAARRQDTAARGADAARPMPAENTTAGAAGPAVVDVGVAAELLALIVAEARAPSPPHDGLRAHRLAQELAGGATGLRVDLDVLRMLFAGPGSMPQAGRILLRFVEPSAAAAELRRLLAGGQSAQWRGALPGEIEARLAGEAGNLLSEDELRSMYASPNERMRETAFELLVHGHFVGADELQRLSRSDPSHSIRGTALDALIAGMATGRSDRATVTAEVLRVARDRDDPLQEKAINALGDLGPEGTRLAVELIISGAVPPDLVSSLAHTVVRGGRTEDLVHAQVRGESLRRMIDVLEEAVNDETKPIDTAVVARVLRSCPLPEDAETAATFLRLAIAVGASDMAVSVAQRREVTQRIRVIASAALLDAEPPRSNECLTAAASILEVAPVDAVWRREFLEDAGADLVEGSLAGRALVERLAKDDPDPWVRREAAQLIRDAR